MIMERYEASNWDIICQPRDRGGKITTMYNIRNRMNGDLEINWTRHKDTAIRKIEQMIDERLALLQAASH
jgi:hypothetical protein